MRKYGYKVYYGDATQSIFYVLRVQRPLSLSSLPVRAGRHHEAGGNMPTALSAFAILARARGRVEAHELLQAGVTSFPVKHSPVR